MTYIARFARQNRAPSPTSPELTTRITSRAKLPVLYRAQILAYLIAVDECVTVFESAMGGEPGLAEDGSQRCSDQSGAI
jgi:hypothetical protein